MTAADELFILSGWPQDQANGYSLEYLLHKMPFANAKNNIYCELKIHRYLPDKYGASWISEDDSDDDYIEVAETATEALINLANTLIKNDTIKP